MKLMLVMLLLAGSAARAEWKPPNTADVALLAVAETALVVDALQALSFKSHCGGWLIEGAERRCVERGITEKNPLLGRHPSDGRILAYFGANALALGAAWYFLPRPWRDLAAGAVIAIEIPLIAKNHSLGARLTLPF